MSWRPFLYLIINPHPVLSARRGHLRPGAGLTLHSVNKRGITNLLWMFRCPYVQKVICKQHNKMRH